MNIWIPGTASEQFWLQAYICKELEESTHLFIISICMQKSLSLHEARGLGELTDSESLQLCTTQQGTFKSPASPHHPCSPACCRGTTASSHRTQPIATHTGALLGYLGITGLAPWPQPWGLMHRSHNGRQQRAVSPGKVPKGCSPWLLPSLPHRTSALWACQLCWQLLQRLLRRVPSQNRQWSLFPARNSSSWVKQWLLFSDG